jgi:hypothetical protein
VKEILFTDHAVLSFSLPPEAAADIETQLPEIIRQVAMQGPTMELLRRKFEEQLLAQCSPAERAAMLGLSCQVQLLAPIVHFVKQERRQT